MTAPRPPFYRSIPPIPEAEVSVLPIARFAARVPTL